MPALLYLLNALLLLVYLPGVPAQEAGKEPGWELVRDDRNIRVYSAAAENSTFKKIKVEAVVEGKWKNILPVFEDIAGYDKWVYATERSYLIRKRSDRESLYYIETDLPWPAKNRDAAIRMTISESPAGTISIRTVGEPNAIPATEGHVRVPHFTGQWTFRKAGNGKIRITYYLHLDPGGSLPSWIVNSFIAKGPFDTITELSALLKH